MQPISENPLNILIEGWGRMGSPWGIGKVMAEIHALLYLHRKPMSLEEMSERLKTSRSNISLNVRALQDLGVVKKTIVPGDRKDYYSAEENVGRVARRLAAEKKKRELDPALRIVDRAIEAAELAEVQGGSKDGFEGVDVDRLRELKSLMEGIAGIFETFIDDGSSNIGVRETVNTQNA